MLTAWKLAPALAAGNTVVQKPSEETPVSALRFAELVHRHTDFPAGAYSVVPGYGEEAGAALAAHTDVDKLTLAGSSAVGREVAADAARTLRPSRSSSAGRAPRSSSRTRTWTMP